MPVPTKPVPKPMVRVMGKPIIGYIIDLLRSHGVDEAAVTLGYLPDAIEKEYSDCRGINLSMLREDEPLGTAGCVKRAAAGFKEPFFVKVRRESIIKEKGIVRHG